MQVLLKNEKVSGKPVLPLVSGMWVTFTPLLNPLVRRHFSLYIG